MTAVSVVDFGMGNLDSVMRALQECGATPRLTASPDEVASSERVVLPGVGAFSDGMRAIRERGLDQALESARRAGASILGICLGMQLLAEEGLEGGRTRGLGWIPGLVGRLSPAPGERVPHVGWNEVHRTAAGRTSRLTSALADGRDFYFVHSYAVACASPDDVLATTPYCGGVPSIIGRGQVFGVQFHPEKSQRAGLGLLRSFLAL